MGRGGAGLRENSTENAQRLASDIFLLHTKQNGNFLLLLLLLAPLGAAQRRGENGKGGGGGGSSFDNNNCSIPAQPRGL